MKSIYFAIFGDGDFDFGVLCMHTRGLEGTILDLGLQLLIHIDL